MATTTVYADASWHRNAGAGESWVTCPTGSDNVAYGGVGGASSGANYYTWVRFPQSSFPSSSLYTITAANLYVYCEYLNVVRADFTNAYGSSFTPSGTNTPSKSLLAWQYTFGNKQWYNSNSYSDTNNVLSWAQGVQSGTYNGLFFTKGGVGRAYYEIGAINSRSTAYRPYVTLTYQNRSYTTTVSRTPTAGGTVSVQYSSRAWGSSNRVTATPSTGYRFVRWNFTGLSVSTSTSATYNFTMPSNNVTAQAVFEKITYTISYNGNAQNGGTVSNVPASQTKTYGKNLTLSSTRPIHSDLSATPWTITCDSNGGSASDQKLAASRTTKYTFSYWDTARDGSGINYDPGDTYTRNEANTMYAQWTSNVTISAVTLPSTAGTKTGYAFIGWSTSSTATTATYNPGASYTPSSNNITLYAVWELQEIPISYLDDWSGYYRITGPTNYNLTTATGIDITVEPNDGYMITNIQVKVTQESNPGSWNTILNLTQYESSATYHITHQQLGGSYNDTLSVQIRANSYYYPRLHIGDTEYTVAYKDDTGSIQNIIPYHHDTQQNKWIPGYGEIQTAQPSYIEGTGIYVNVYIQNGSFDLGGIYVYDNGHPIPAEPTQAFETGTYEYHQWIDYGKKLTIQGGYFLPNVQITSAKYSLSGIVTQVQENIPKTGIQLSEYGINSSTYELSTNTLTFDLTPKKISGLGSTKATPLSLDLYFELSSPI